MNAAPFTLDKFAEGRFDVLAENGHRVGSVIGGGSGSNASWGAEVGNKVLGYFRSKRLAAETIMMDQGIKGLFNQMQEVIEGPSGLLKHFMDDFYVVDKATIEKWKCATSFLWVVRETGTHLVQLDCPFSQREGLAILEALHPSYTGNQWQLYLIDVNDLKVKAVTEAEATRLVKQTPKYDFKNGFVTRWGKAVAEVKLKRAMTMKYGVRALVEIHCDEEPCQRTLALLPRMGFYAIRLEENSMFAAPESLEVFVGKKCLFRWDNPQQ